MSEKENETMRATDQIGSPNPFLVATPTSFPLVPLRSRGPSFYQKQLFCTGCLESD